ncbi:hypothetical protein QN277_023471 [Acacia crassicarpa]|uniref:Uncharacterized protein n=1 Tax=Acacia crassicarpa TaxID=499986 RepID=A0AAE1JHA5_9FABA|nr:hypothetical protein QN277_023471 [Acacia crassicarpa]
MNRVSSDRFQTSSLPLTSFNLKQLIPPMGLSRPRVAAFSSSSNTGGAREILVQHLLVKEDDHKLLLDLQQRISSGDRSEGKEARRDDY